MKHRKATHWLTARLVALTIGCVSSGPARAGNLQRAHHAT
jgi:hypothetical protein